MSNSGATTGSSARRNAVEIEVMWTPAAAHAGKASRAAAAAFGIATMMFDGGCWLLVGVGPFVHKGLCFPPDLSLPAKSLLTPLESSVAQQEELLGPREG